MSIIYSVLGFIMGFSLVCLIIPPLIRVSIAKHLYDIPNARKASKTIVPTLGGVSIFIAFILSTIIATNDYNSGELKYTIAAVLILFFIGLKDDLIDLSARKKLVVQIATAAMLIILGNFRFTNLHGAFGLYEINYSVSFTLTLFSMIALINAFNLIDGIDGLSSGISIVVSSVFGTWFLLAGHQEYAIMCFSLTGSLIGFFLFNVFGMKNKIFMGDSGSLVLGVLMAIWVIKFNELNVNQALPYAVSAAPAVSIGILIIPVVDTLRVFFIRLSERRSPFSPDMNHIHHKLLQLGFTHLGATSLIVFFNILFISFTLIFHKSVHINTLMIGLFASGFSVAYIPSLIIKWKQFPDLSIQQIPALKNESKRARIISKVTSRISTTSPTIPPSLVPPKITAKNEFEKSNVY